MAKIQDLTPDLKNANKGTERGRAMLEASLRKYGAGRSILVDKHGTVIAGNKTLETAAEIGFEDLQVVQTDGTKIVAVQRMDLDLSKDPKARELAYADNRIAEVDLDFEIERMMQDVEDGIDLKGMWSDAELNKLFKTQTEAPDAQVDQAEALQASWGTEKGQIWEIGPHRLMCGDSTEKADVEALLVGERPALTLSDPPYGLGGGKASGKNNYNIHDDTKENLVELAKGWFPLAQKVCNTIVFSPGVTNTWLYPEADWVMCWFYGGGQFRSPWGFNCWQPFLCYGKDPSLAAGQGGRPDAVDMNVPASAAAIHHPCPKPLKLWEWMINRLSFGEKDKIYDPFLGSGTTMVAAQQLDRTCHGMEIDPSYVAVCLERMKGIGCLGTLLR